MQKEKVYNLNVYDNRVKSLHPRQARLTVGERPYDPPKYEDKSGTLVTRYPNISWDCGSAKHGTIRVITFDLVIMYMNFVF